MSAAGLTDLQQKQLSHVDEMLQESSDSQSVAKDLFFGRFCEQAVFPFPEQDEEGAASLEAFLDELRAFCKENIDADAIDRNGKIPASVIKGLGKLGVLGFTADTSVGGQGGSQFEFCKIMEVLGEYCSSTAAFVSSQQSVGLKAIELFGSDAQKEQWGQAIASGKKSVAFALTEAQAGSDINNVRTRAEPDGDDAFVISGDKRWITNGADADVLIVMARTPDHAHPDGAVTAFLIPMDAAGVKVTEKRLEKIGFRGVTTSNISLTDVKVTSDDVIGKLGSGMEVVDTVLAFGRMSMGSAAVGATKFCIEKMIERANGRHQFGITLGDFELVQQKISTAAADCYAMESANLHLAKSLTADTSDCDTEAAMIKIFGSEALWKTANDCLEVWGGLGVFTDQPFERLVRDARLNLIGDCANDALRSFIALVGFRHVGKDLNSEDGGLVSGIRKKLGVMGESLVNPSLPIKHDHLKFYARGISKQIGQLSWQLKMALTKNASKVYAQQHVQGRLADIATELFMATCVYARISGVMVNGTIPQPIRDREYKIAQMYLTLAHRRNEHRLEDMKQNCDKEISSLAEILLGDDEQA